MKNLLKCLTKVKINNNTKKTSILLEIRKITKNGDKVVSKLVTTLSPNCFYINFFFATNKFL